MATLLLELFSEEIPSRMQRAAAEQLQRLMLEGFKKHGLAPAGCKTFVSPRHLAIQCFGLPTIQPDVREEKRGPKIGAPEQALKGFLSASGLAIDQCEQRDGYYYATIERKGQPTADVAKKIIEDTLSAFSWPKSMHWGNRDARPIAWVRPLHRIACLLDDAVVPVAFAHLTASNLTEGHRFLAPAPITLGHAEEYEAKLLAAKVIVDFAARRTKIAAEIATLATSANLTVVADEDLLNEVTGLVEWPVPLLCQFDAKFLNLPPEVLISEMKNHQRYFALYGADGKLTNRFITVANMENADGGARVKDGNARVVRARLADGEFYWEQDRKVSLEDWGKKLSDVVFHAKVGMMDAKVARIEKLATDIAIFLFRPKLDALTPVKRAAQLCKADLTSGMVGEFPELQGIMGRYYAKDQGVDKDIAEAIYEHYKPQGAGDDLPKTELGAIISIADKLDSIIALFKAGEKPTGSKDPLALRRAALGILRITLHKEWMIDLASLGVRGEVADFFNDRLHNILRDEGIRHDVIEAIASTEGFNAVVIANQTRALAAWLETESGKNTLAAIKRAQNILAAEEKKAKAPIATILGNGDLFLKLAKDEEKALLAAVQQAGNRKLEILESLTAPINAFFEACLVNEEGFREARLSLLASVRDAANTYADFSKIEG